MNIASALKRYFAVGDPAFTISRRLAVASFGTVCSAAVGSIALNACGLLTDTAAMSYFANACLALVALPAAYSLSVTARQRWANGKPDEGKPEGQQ